MSAHAIAVVNPLNPSASAIADVTRKNLRSRKSLKDRLVLSQSSRRG